MPAVTYCLLFVLVLGVPHWDWRRPYPHNVMPIALSCIHDRVSALSRHELTKYFFLGLGANPWANGHQKDRWLATRQVYHAAKFRRPPSTHAGYKKYLWTNKVTHTNTTFYSTGWLFWSQGTNAAYLTNVVIAGPTEYRVMISDQRR